jgi:putative transposase
LVETEGAFVHEIGGTATHVHLVATIAPTILISDLVGQLTGACSHEVNRQIGHRDKTLQWQSGYGVVSFGSHNLKWVCAYVRNQRRHHAAGTVFQRLERIAPPDD